MVIGIQLQSERLDLLHILFLERFPELLCDQFHTLTKRLQVIALLDRFQRPLQIVHQRQEILHALGASALHQLHLLPQRALAEIVELGLQTQVLVLPLRNLRLPVARRQLLRSRFRCIPIPCHCVSIGRAFICHIGTRLPVAGGIPIARREAFVAANRFIINLFLVHI